MAAPAVVINYWAVLVAAGASMVIGFLWYSPFLFGKQWVKLMRFDAKKMAELKKGMSKTYIVAFLGVLVMSFVLAHFVKYVQATTVGGGAQVAFWLWLGFVAPVTLGVVLWEGKSVKLYIINVLHYLVALLVMAAILAVWR